MSLVTNIDNIFMKGVIGRVRKAQEDSHGMELKTPNGDVFVVCDGMGGHVGGSTASTRAVDNIICHLKEEKYPDPITALDGALRRANDQVYGFASANPEFMGMGTTACVVLMQNNEVWIAHVGDSRIYLYLGEEKKLHRLTKDHSYVQSLLDAGTITLEQAEHHKNKNRILRAIGVKPETQPTFNETPIRPKNGDIFLICSDGLSGMIPDSSIEEVLGQDLSLEAKGELLINRAMEGETVHPGGQDNCTLELIQIDNSPWPVSEFTSFNPQYTPVAERSITQANQVSEPEIVQPTRQEDNHTYTSPHAHSSSRMSSESSHHYGPPMTRENEKKRKSHRTLIISVIITALLITLGIICICVNNNPQRIESNISNLNNEISEKEAELDSVEIKILTAKQEIKKAENNKKNAVRNGSQDVIVNADNSIRSQQKLITVYNKKDSSLNEEIKILKDRQKKLQDKLDKKHSNESNNHRKR